jgi:hypothetical protein
LRLQRLAATANLTNVKPACEQRSDVHRKNYLSCTVERGLDMENLLDGDHVIEVLKTVGSEAILESFDRTILLAQHLVISTQTKGEICH